MKLTPWFPGSVKPVRVGVYLRDHESWGECFQYFNGEWWGFPAYDPRDAWAERHTYSDDQTSRWRGLAEEPK